MAVILHFPARPRFTAPPAPPAVALEDALPVYEAINAELKRLTGPADHSIQIRVFQILWSKISTVICPYRFDGDSRWEAARQAFLKLTMVCNPHRPPEPREITAAKVLIEMACPKQAWLCQKVA